MRFYRPLFLFSALAVLLCGFTVPPFHEVERRAFESVLNTALRDYFAGTLKVGRAHLGRDFRLQLSEVEGELVTRERPVAIRLQTLESVEPLYRLLFLKPVHFAFTGLKPAGSPHPGVSGKAQAKPGWKWDFMLEANIESLGLEDIVWVNPDSLAGSSGRMIGTLEVKADYTGHSEFKMELSVPEPGGSLQARFFDSVTPYLPKTKKKSKKNAETLAATHETIGYRQAELTAQLENDDQVKMLLRIMIPDYNLKLNLTLLVKVDEKNAFLKLFQLLGIIQGQTPKAS